VFVTHDLAVAAGFCDRIAVMRRGVIVEEGSTLELMRNPATAYTRALVESICTFETDPDRPLRVPGDEARAR
jgi:ABC-type dipeptide/oligopeptide/nickel transport system ATPase component